MTLLCMLFVRKHLNIECSPFYYVLTVPINLRELFRLHLLHSLVFKIRSLKIYNKKNTKQEQTCIKINTRIYSVQCGFSQKVALKEFRRPHALYNESCKETR